MQPLNTKKWNSVWVRTYVGVDNLVSSPLNRNGVYAHLITKFDRTFSSQDK